MQYLYRRKPKNTASSVVCKEKEHRKTTFFPPLPLFLLPYPPPPQFATWKKEEEGKEELHLLEAKKSPLFTLFSMGNAKVFFPSHGTRIHNKLPRKLAPNLNELYLKSPSFRKITDDHLKISLMKSIKVFLRMKQLPVSSSTQLVFKFFSAIPNLHRRLILTFLGEREVWEGGGLLA